MTARHVLPEDEARHIITQILSAISYLHRSDIVHRDIKPLNVLMAEDGQVKLIDFGLSKSVPADSLCITPCGSVGYAAPEAFGPRPYDGRAADVFSCGVLLYEMVAGQKPWRERSNPARLVQEMKEGGICPPPFATASCQDLVVRMLNPAPTERPSIEDVLQHPWVTNNTGVHHVLSLSQGIPRDDGRSSLPPLETGDCTRRPSKRARRALSMGTAPSKYWAGVLPSYSGRLQKVCQPQSL
jgi:serine/threonine protein kinase